MFLKQWMKYSLILIAINTFFVIFGANNVVFASFYLIYVGYLSIMLFKKIYKKFKFNYKKFNKKSWYKSPEIHSEFKLMYLLIIPAIFLLQGQVSWAYSDSTKTILNLSTSLLINWVFALTMFFVIANLIINFRNLIKNKNKSIYKHINLEPTLFDDEILFSVISISNILNFNIKLYCECEQPQEKNIDSNLRKTYFYLLQTISVNNGDAFSL